MDTKIKKILSKGLGEGYMGKSTRGKTVRAGFDLDTSDYSGVEGKYHDEWMAMQNGGGQELVETSDGITGTRVYAGGSLSDPELLKLGITGKEVIKMLVSFVNKSEGKARLDENIEFSEGDWKYTYQVLESVKEIPVDLGKETITYKETLVFIHYHIISPVA